MKQTELKIECDENMNRFYIPIGAGWEIQTKGDGSTFRVGNVNEDQNYGLYGIDDHAMKILERMAREVNAEHDTLTKRNDAMVEALRFYAKHEHWMGLTEDDDTNTILVAVTSSSINGYDVAEKALAAAKALEAVK